MEAFHQIISCGIKEMVASQEGAIEGRGVPPDTMGFHTKRFFKGRGIPPNFP